MPFLKINEEEPESDDYASNYTYFDSADPESFKKAKEEDFRYKTAKPTCIESMVLMVCDAIEATSRAMAQAGKFDPNKVINETLQRLIDDGQLDDVTMKLGDLKKIKSALAKELEGVYQKRVDYDEASEEGEDDD